MSDGPVDDAVVVKAGVPAATLRRTRDGIAFRYLDDYRRDGGAAVATTLPLGDDDVLTPSGAVPAYFAGLLPEGRRLTALRRELKVSADDELSLLAAIGSDTVGDVQVFPAEGPQQVADPVIDFSPRRPLDFTDLIGDLAPAERVGLPGVQDKVSGRMIAVPARRAGERFILKLNPPEYPHVVENEALMIATARRSGLTTVKATLVRDVHGTPGLLVTRFDRVPLGDGDVAARAVEDGCQVLGRWPADKYSVSSEELALVLIGLCAARPVAARDIFRQFAFAVATGNGDLHAKNLSVLQQPGGEWRIAPAYDLPSTALYGDSTLALRLGGKRTGVSRRILLDFAENLQLPRPAASRWLDQILVGTQNLVERLEADAVPLPADRLRKGIRELANRRRLLSE